MIRQRWLELAKQHHPDIGGDGAIFRQAKEAYEILRDSARRAEYERFWLRALGPFERVASREEVPLLTAMGGAPHGWARTQARETPAPPVAEPAPPAEDAGAGIRFGALFARAEALLAPVAAADVTALHADVAGTIAELERISAELSVLAAVQRALEA
jgi:curved DNA-binding protein CbpA